jgi:signal transduction histidine kinase
VEQQHGIRVVIEDDGQPKPLDDDIRALLYRTVQELLVNVARHAQALDAEVSISREDGRILIAVEDDGIGFHSEEVLSRIGETEGFGLFSIYERLVELGGSFQIKSTPGGGTQALLVAPLAQNKESRGRE